MHGMRGTAVSVLLAAVICCCSWWYHSVIREVVSDVVCGRGEFSLPGMADCHPLLTCAEFQPPHLNIYEIIGKGAVKIVRRAEWKGYSVAHNMLATPIYAADFHHGLDALSRLQPSAHVTRLLGSCGDTFITQYHPHGPAADVHALLACHEMHHHDNLHTKFSLCISYVEVIMFLHHSPIGTRVMCDSSDLYKTLNQFLLTSDLKIIANDLDALPLVDKSQENNIKCGHRQLYGEFVAPEQLWPHLDRPFVDEEMATYDEKTDIWKIPAVCNFFLGTGPGADSLRFHLFKIHKQCKSVNVENRPSSSEVLEQYRTVAQEFLIE